VTFSKAQSSKLERLFCHVSVKRDVRALSFEIFEVGLAAIKATSIKVVAQSKSVSQMGKKK